MKKQILSAIALTTISLSLSGCGGGSDDQETISNQGLVSAEQAAKMRQIDSAIPEGHARYIIELNPSTSTSQDAAAVKTQQQAQVAIQEIKSALSLSGLNVIHKQALANVGVLVADVPLKEQEKFVAQLKSDSKVLSVTPDAIVSVSQEDPVLSTQGIATFPYDAKYWWNLDRINQRALPLDKKYSYAFRATSVTTYVVDTGISPHAELVNVKPGFSAISDNGGTLDCHGHGTAVASQIAGLNVGVTPGTATVPVRVMTCTGSGFVSQILSGLDWIAANGKLPAVINMSLGTSAGVDVLDQAVQKLVDRGFVAVSAAGNSNVDACTSSPARLPTGITVGASTITDTRASFSNFGSCVSLFAPGDQTIAAYYGDPGSYMLVSGTSFSAPITTGVAALILEKRQAWSPASVKSQLLYQSTKSVVTNSQSPAPHLLYSPINVYQPLKDAQMAYVDSITPTMINQPSSWKSGTKVKLKDALGAPVIGAQVYGYFSNMATPVVCTTATDGACVVYSASMSRSVKSVTFMMDTVRNANVIYTPAKNKASMANTYYVAP